jgi:hypothetical protein
MSQFSLTVVLPEAGFRGLRAYEFRKLHNLPEGVQVDLSELRGKKHISLEVAKLYPTIFQHELEVNVELKVEDIPLGSLEEKHNKVLWNPEYRYNVKWFLDHHLKQEQE